MVQMVNGKMLGVTAALAAIVIMLAASPIIAQSTVSSGAGAVQGSKVAQTAPATVYYPTSRTITMRSTIPTVEITGFTILSSKEIKVSVRQLGAQKTPQVTLVVSTEWILMPRALAETAVPVQPDMGADTTAEYYPRPFPQQNLVGSTVLTGDWGPSTEVKLSLMGTGSAYDSNIQILAIPYTGSS